MTELKLRNICKSYGEKVILDSVNLDLRMGETICILGKSGCGKSTLFNIISGLISPDSGNVYIDKKEITKLPGFVGYMPQKNALFPFKTIRENVLLPILIQNGSHFQAQINLDDYFDKFLISGTENKYPHELSGGMRQRAAFLRTLMFNKDFMLFDEPFSSLDNITKLYMYKWYKDNIKGLGRGVMLITHSIDEAIKLGDKIFILSEKSHSFLEVKDSDGNLERKRNYILDKLSTI